MKKQELSRVDLSNLAERITSTVHGAPFSVVQHEERKHETSGCRQLKLCCMVPTRGQNVDQKERRCKKKPFPEPLITC